MSTRLMLLNRSPRRRPTRPHSRRPHASVQELQFGGDFHGECAREALQTQTTARPLFSTILRGHESTELEGAITAGRKSYLVVELQTAANPTIHRKDSHAFGAGGKVVVPVRTIATGGVDVLGLGAALDTEVGAGLHKSNSLEKSFTIHGENIFAVEHKQVVWKSWGLKKKLEKASLDDKITWSLMGQRRGREDQEEVISMELTDDLKQKPEKDEDAEDGDDDGLDDDDEEEGVVKQANIDGETYMYAGGSE